MKIIIFGATGGVGQCVVKQALEKNFEVTAFVRTPSKLQIHHEHLHIIQEIASIKRRLPKPLQDMRQLYPA